MNTRRLLASALTITLMACSDSGTAPIQQSAFDVQAALSDHQALTSLLASPALASFQTIGQRVSLHSSSAARVEVISHEARGTTFVYDPESDRYVASPDRTDAPANGVRFILYAVDEATGRPDVDRETGHADLIDQGVADTPPISLRFVVVNGGATRMDYSVTAAGSETSSAIATTGFVSDDANRLNFGITVNSVRDSQTEATQVRFDLAMEDRGFQASATMTGVNTESGRAGQVELAARHGESTVQVSITNNGTTLDATFRVNGHVLATASGDPQNPVFQSGSGNALTDEEKEALWHIMGLTGQVFGLFTALMDPADDLIRLGVAL